VCNAELRAQVAIGSPATCIVQTHATLELRGPLWLLQFLLERAEFRRDVADQPKC
jgi:hypothetical protein